MCNVSYSWNAADRAAAYKSGATHAAAFSGGNARLLVDAGSQSCSSFGNIVGYR